MTTSFSKKINHPDAPFYRRLIDDLDEGVVFLNHEREIVFWSRGMERLTGFSEAEAKSGGCTRHCMRFAGLEEIRACDGACSIHRTLSTGEAHEEDIYFQHKEGHRIPVNLRLVPFRPESGGPVEGVMELLRDNALKEGLKTEVSDLRKMALIDPLSELGNRRYGAMNLSTHLEEYKRYGTPFGVLFIDIDNFKAVNDKFGHDAGDRIIRMIGRTLHYNLRTFDVSARWGGEEFLAIILNVNTEQLTGIAEKVRALVETSPVRYGASMIKVTVSIGAALACGEDTELGLVNRADAAMYESKKNGRNRVTPA
jgi:diguanylate cyclase (GGDEF)-like protein/PAS domain S-box-containing protein